jgi:hypothetical protein
LGRTLAETDRAAGQNRVTGGCQDLAHAGFADHRNRKRRGIDRVDHADAQRGHQPKCAREKALRSALDRGLTVTPCVSLVDLHLQNRQFVRLLIADMDVLFGETFLFQEQLGIALADVRNSRSLGVKHRLTLLQRLRRIDIKIAGRAHGLIRAGSVGLAGSTCEPHARQRILRIERIGGLRAEATPQRGLGLGSPCRPGIVRLREDFGHGCTVEVSCARCISAARDSLLPPIFCSWSQVRRIGWPEASFRKVLL